MAEKSSGFGKWLGGIIATVITAVLVWALTRPSGGMLNPSTPTAPPPTPIPTAPHAPTLNAEGFSLAEERLKLFEIQPGQQYNLNMMDIWMVPLVEPPSCASGFVVISWIVRDPYPIGGEDLEVLTPIHSADGKTQVIGSGQEGSARLGYCDEAYFFNHSLQIYKVEFRYASGISR